MESIVKNDKKKCSICSKYLAFSQFHKHKLGVLGLYPSCKNCREPYRVEYYDANREQILEKDKLKNIPDADGFTKGRKRYLRKMYNLSPDEYTKMIEAQDNLCGICGQPERTTDKFGKIKSLAVDHNHETGEVRGLLCNTCNICLGLMKDDKYLLESAINYLTKYSQ